MMPNFFMSEYFVPEVDNWHLKDGAPDDVRREFEEYMASGGDIVFSDEDPVEKLVNKVEKTKKRTDYEYIDEVEVEKFNPYHIKIVSGDTFSNKAALKAAGFKWNSKKRVWEKPEDVVKNNVEYIDEPVSFDILKSDDDKRLVFGWASIAQTSDGETVEDIQNDIIEPEDLEEAAYEYVLNFRDTGEEHLPGYRKKGKLIESCVFTEEKQRAMGLAPGSLPVGWWIGFHIGDDNTWRRIKNGTYKMFSIEGKAERVPVEKKAPTGCGVIVLNDDGEVLTGKRTKENVIGGPGGHIEEGETPEEAAIRETYEEFGIVCRDLQSLGVLDGGEKYGDSAVFLCDDYSGHIKTDPKEMTEPQWLSIENLEDKDLFLPFAQSIDLYRESNVEKFNPYHDSLGRFTTASGAKSFTIRTKAGMYQQGMVDRAIEREKKRTASKNYKLEITGTNHKLPRLDSEQAEKDRTDAIGKVEEKVNVYAPFIGAKGKAMIDKDFEKYVSETDPKVWSRRAKLSRDDAWYDFKGTTREEAERKQRDLEAKRAEEKRKFEDIRNMKEAISRAKEKKSKKAQAFFEYENELRNKYRDESLNGPEKYNYWSRATDAEKQKLNDLEAALVMRDKHGKWRVAKTDGEFWDDDWEYTENNQGFQKSVPQNAGVDCIIEL